MCPHLPLSPLGGHLAPGEDRKKRKGDRVFISPHELIDTASHVTSIYFIQPCDREYPGTAIAAKRVYILVIIERVCPN